jgi:hypothetical protein
VRVVRLKAEYDSRVLIPKEPVRLPTGVPLDLIVENASEPSASSLLDLAGLGAEIWDGVDPVEYQRRERSEVK